VSGRPYPRRRAVVQRVAPRLQVDQPPASHRHYFQRVLRLVAAAAARHGTQAPEEKFGGIGGARGVGGEVGADVVDTVGAAADDQVVPAL
jgi:hypothetical protein